MAKRARDGAIENQDGAGRLCPTHTSNSRDENPRRFLRLPAVENRVGLGKSSIYAMIAARQFPAAIPIGERAVGWLESDIEAWISARIAQARASTPAQPRI